MSSSKPTPSGLASGHGIATYFGTTVLDVWFPSPSLGALSALSAQSEKALSPLLGVDEVRKVKRELVSIEIDLAIAPQNAIDAYLRLHLLSHRLIQPHGAVMDGIFGLLTNVVWTSAGPCAIDGLKKFAPDCAKSLAMSQSLESINSRAWLITLFRLEFVSQMPIEFD